MSSKQRIRSRRRGGFNQTITYALFAFLLIIFLGTLSVNIKFLNFQHNHEVAHQQETLTPLQDLIHLYETLPEVSTSKTIPPPFRELTYAYPRQKTPPSNHITLSTQITVSKFPRLLNLLERWNGPISCAVHLKNIDEIEHLDKFIQQHQGSRVSELVTFHVMLERPSKHFYYPINRMRNLALHNIDTDYFFNCDVDFMTRVNAHDDLVKFLSKNANQRYSTLWVLPAFERFPLEKNTDVTSLDLIPKTKQEVLSLKSQKKVLQPFHLEYFPPGHKPTNFNKWYRCSGDDSYPIEFAYYFEPYVIGNRHGIPDFIDKFRGYGSNKASWVAEAHFGGYEFRVLCSHFVVHMNHAGREKRGVTSHPTKKWFIEEYLTGRYNASVKP